MGDCATSGKDINVLFNMVGNSGIFNFDDTSGKGVKKYGKFFGACETGNT